MTPHDLQDAMRGQQQKLAILGGPQETGKPCLLLFCRDAYSRPSFETPMMMAWDISRLRTR